MAYEIHINRRTTTPYDPGSGEWLDGDTFELADHGTTVETPDEYDLEEFGNPVAWAIDRLRRTDAHEPSQLPVPDRVGEHAWLGGCYCHPYNNEHEETTARLYGDWTPEERAEVFRGVTV